MIRIVLLLAAVLLVSSANAQMMTTYFGEGGMGGVSPPLTPCGAMQADLSDATGCNMTAFVEFLK